LLFARHMSVWRQEYLPRSSRNGVIFHPPPVHAAKVFSDKLYPFVAQKALGKGSVFRADIRKASDDARAPEELGLQTLAPGAAFQKTVYQQLHEMDAISFSVAASRSLDISRQKKVIHAADSGLWVAQTGGHAGAEDGRQNDVRVVDNAEFALHNVNPLYRVMVGG